MSSGARPGHFSDAQVAAEIGAALLGRDEVAVPERARGRRRPAGSRARRRSSCRAGSSPAARPRPGARPRAGARRPAPASRDRRRRTGRAMPSAKRAATPVPARVERADRAPGLDLDPRGRERPGQRRHQRRHPVAQRGERPEALLPGRSGGRRGTHRPPVRQPGEQQAPVLPLRDAQLGHDGVQAQLVDRRAVDAARRAARRAGRRAATPAARRRNVPTATSSGPRIRGQTRSLRHPQLLGPRRTAASARTAGRGSAARAPRPPGSGTSSPPWRMATRRGAARPDQLVAEAQVAGQRDRRPARVDEDRVRPVLDDEAVDPLGRDLAAQPRPGLHERDRDAVERQRRARRRAR